MPNTISGLGSSPWVRKVVGAVTSLVPKVITDRIGIGVASANGECAIEADSIGGVLVTGTTGAVPIAGAGTRFMWAPAKQALRAGVVTGTEWDSANIGTASLGVGSNSKASGAYSTCTGTGGVASGTNSVALGYFNQATNTTSVAIGSGCTASGVEAVSIGKSCSAQQSGSVAIGVSSQSTATRGVAIGSSSLAQASYSTAIGDSCQVATSASYSTAIGKACVVGSSAQYCCLLGNANQCSASNSYALGSDCAPAETYTVALGYKCAPVGRYGVSVCATSKNLRNGGLACCSYISTPYATEGQHGWEECFLFRECSVAATDYVLTQNGSSPAGTAATFPASNRLILESERGYIITGNVIAIDLAGDIHTWAVRASVYPTGVAPNIAFLGGAATVTSDGGSTVEAGNWTLTVGTDATARHVVFTFNAPAMTNGPVRVEAALRVQQLLHAT